MPFLQVNGWTIPVASVRRKPLLLGGRGRAYDGTPQTQDRGRKRIYECKTPPLIEQTRNAIIGIIRGDGFVWPWSSGLWSHKGVGPATGTDQATQLDYLAGDGDPVSLMSYLHADSESNYTPTRNGMLSVDPDSTNMLAADQRDAEGVVAGSYTAIGGAALSIDTDHYWQGTKSVKVTVAAGANEGVRTDLMDPGAGSATKTYTGSVYVKNGAASARNFTVSLWDNTNGVGSSGVTMALAPGEWGRIADTITIGGVACRDLWLLVTMPNGVAAEAFYFDGFQIEEQEYPTAWVDGARGGADDLAYGFDFNYSFADWSVGVWFWGPDDTRFPSAGNDAFIVSIDNAADTARARILREGGGDTITLSIKDAAGTFFSLSSNAADVDWEGWNFVGVSFRTDPETGETRGSMRIINGSGSATRTDDSSVLVALEGATVLYVGHHAGTLHWTGHIGELVFLPFAVPVAVWDGIASTLGQVGDGTAAALPLPQWPRKLVTGDALVAYPIGSNARLYGALFEGDAGSVDMLYGDGRNNLGVVAFMLEEV